jgi:hypothetical protein
MRSGTLLQDMSFTNPTAPLFFNHNPNKFIMACEDDIFIVDVNAQSTQPFIDTPQGAWYLQHALALSDDNAVLVAGSSGSSSSSSVCGYDTASSTRLWIHKTASGVPAVCMLGAHVLATVCARSTLVLDRKTGAQIATLQKAGGWIYGLGVIEGLY